MKSINKILSLAAVCLLIAAAMLASALVCFAADECSHSYSLDGLSGLRNCTKCGELCPHSLWSEGVCGNCGVACVHDWDYTSSESLCRICGATCDNHTRGLDFDCSTCGKERNEDNSLYSGGSYVYDSTLSLGKVHAVAFEFNFSVGSKNTVINVKDTTRDDNIYYSTQNATNSRDYVSLISFVGNDGNGASCFATFCSLWLDNAENKLYLVKANSSSDKICEIKPGVEYGMNVVWEPSNQKTEISVTRLGGEIVSFSASVDGFPGTLTSSSIRFGEIYNSKCLHIQKMAFEDIEFESAFSGGLCRICGNECAHEFNFGGHCIYCGEYGNPIFLSEGQNGGGNESGKKNASPMGVHDGYYSNTTYTQCWDYRDRNGNLIGKNFVIEGSFTFDSWTYDSSNTNGSTPIIIISDNEVDGANWRYSVKLYGKSGKLQIGDSFGALYDVELNKAYDIRVVVREKSNDGEVYTNSVEVLVNGESVCMDSFTLTKTNGFSIRVGDHVVRESKVKYRVADDFAIRVLGSDINYIGMQEKENANYSSDTSFDIRFVFGIDDLHFEDVGVNVKAEMSGSVIYDDVSGSETLSSSQSVLTEIYENGRLSKPGYNGVGYGGYYLALVISGIDLDPNAEYSFTLTPYTKNGSMAGRIFSSKTYVITVSFKDGELVGEVAESETSKISENGLDAIVADLPNSEPIYIGVSADTYVHGKSASASFGSEQTLAVKGSLKTASQLGTDTDHRRTFLMFDISSLKLSEVGAVYLTLNCTYMQDLSVDTPIYIRGTSASWSESNATYSALKKVNFSDTAIGSASITGRGMVLVDITDYVKSRLSEGETTLNLIVDGENNSNRMRIEFSSRESGNGPMLKITESGRQVVTDFEYDDINPWQVAMDGVTTWLERWEDIKANGTSDAERITKISSEYAVSVDAANADNTNGDSTRYTTYATRLVEKLKDYVESTAELALYDEYGGYKGGERYEATGFFYTKKIGDRWWVIDPEGYRFYRTACVQIKSGSSSAQENVSISKYGSISNWAQAATDRMRELGFNSTGGWSDTENLINTENPLAQCTIIYTMSKYASSLGLNESSSGNTDLMGDIIPSFDPAFETFADKIIKAGVSDYVNSPYIYGWMSDNELPSNLKMLDNALALDYNDQRFIYSYAVAWTFMYLKTGNVNVRISDVTDELRKEYRAMVFDKYYEVVTSIFDKYDPNHMYLGCRLIGNNYRDEYVMRVSGYWCDIVTFNYYGVWTPDAQFIANAQNWANAPFVVTEWYAKGMDACTPENGLTNKSGAGWTVKTQADRGKFYQNYALQLLECKGCVGFDWFKYWDNDPDDKTADLSNRNSNKGILDGNGNEYSDLVGYMAELNTQKYNLIEFFDKR